MRSRAGMATAAGCGWKCSASGARHSDAALSDQRRANGWASEGAEVVTLAEARERARLARLRASRRYRPAGGPAERSAPTAAGAAPPP